MYLFCMHDRSFVLQDQKAPPTSSPVSHKVQCHLRVFFWPSLLLHASFDDIRGLGRTERGRLVRLGLKLSVEVI